MAFVLFNMGKPCSIFQKILNKYGKGADQSVHTCKPLSRTRSQSEQILSIPEHTEPVSTPQLRRELSSSFHHPMMLKHPGANEIKWAWLLTYYIYPVFPRKTRATLSFIRLHAIKNLVNIINLFFRKMHTA